MTEPAEHSPVELFIQETHTDLERAKRELKEISLLVEQSQGEVEKLGQRNAEATNRVHQMQAHFDTVPREDIQATYEAAQDAQQRLFTMRGQLEKLESDQKHLARISDYMTKTLELLEGKPVIEHDESEISGSNFLESIIQAQEEERRKISRQIHDGPAQVLSNFILQTEIAARLFDTDQEQAREELEVLKEAATASFGNVRDFIFDLRPMMLDDLGIIPTVRRYVEAIKEKTGLEINLVVTGTERRLEMHKEVVVFRSIQELLANARDHAQATQVKVTLDVDDQNIRASVEDNGTGFDRSILDEEAPPESGLRRLRDQIELFQGTLDIKSEPGEGTRVAFSIPAGD
jgi:two-component system sensor histidine kinase DegS